MATGQVARRSQTPALAAADGADWLLAALAAEGVDILFGNPGSTELPLLDALERQQAVRYVLCPHEAVALGMADGYSQATGRLAAVNVHVTPGLANALAGILNAARGYLATDGAPALSLRAIARDLGMASSALYRYFSSRDELLTREIVSQPGR